MIEVILLVAGTINVSEAEKLKASAWISKDGIKMILAAILRP
jgi:hypothetical protein